MSDTNAPTISTEALISDVLKVIDRKREQEIISRRFGLFERRETLEQIGELLGITRERVRQLEKSVIQKLQQMGEKQQLSGIEAFQEQIIQQLSGSGQVAKISDLTARLVKEPTRIEQARISFLASLCPKLVVLPDDETYYASISTKQQYNDKSLKQAISQVVDVIEQQGEPKDIQTIASAAGIQDVKRIEALARSSKRLANLNGRWGLVKWPLVNPKNIRDKIYIILQEQGRHMHFNEIAEAIKVSDFKRKDVTTQAIHNELIKDKRFVLIGRGIYALREWGYEKGTVADIISQVLKEANQPLHRDEIVKRVLKSRFVKETTILLNLQGKPQFKRVAKATYELSE